MPFFFCCSSSSFILFSHFVFTCNCLQTVSPFACTFTPHLLIYSVVDRHLLLFTLFIVFFNLLPHCTYIRTNKQTYSTHSFIVSGTDGRRSRFYFLLFSFLLLLVYYLIVLLWFGYGSTITRLDSFTHVQTRFLFHSRFITFFIISLSFSCCAGRLGKRPDYIVVLL